MGHKNEIILNKMHSLYFDIISKIVDDWKAI